jgi:peptidoglycan/xylan/chitin deacetylase (PgdA/CDA1 family)
MNLRNTPATLLCFYDYDTQWGADRSRSAGGPKRYGQRDFENTERLLEMHEKYAVPACFAVVGAAALPGERPYHDQRQILAIHKAGHEVGSHSFRHEWLPALDRAGLRETVTSSKAALESCTGAPVTTFVPPFNQPFDYVRKLSFSLSERRDCRPHRTDLRTLCEALRETGYRFCRVAYQSLYSRMAERVTGRPIHRPVRLENIAGLVCGRLNTPVGFADASLRVVDRAVEHGGIVIVYAHPHSLSSDGPQGASALERFLLRISALRRAGVLQVRLPREISSAAGGLSNTVANAATVF